MKRIGFFLAAMAVCCTVGAQTSPVVMTIDGEEVPLAEFQRAYNRNKVSGTSVKDYATLYVNYRLRINEAKRQHIDTMQVFRREFDSYRNKLLEKYVSDPQYEDSVTRSVYDRMKAQLKDSDILSVSHIFLIVPQQAGQAQKDAAKKKIDSIYSALKGGADFAETAKACSQDFNSARRGGMLPDFGPGATLKEFEDKCYSLKKGEMSEPFLSTAGYHIVLMRDRKKLEPYEQRKAELVKILNKQGLKQMVFNHAIDNMVKNSGGKTREQVLQQIMKDHSDEDSTLENTVKDYYEGLLSYYVTKQEAWDKASADKAGMQEFFKKNKKKYKWDSPHFKGFVFHTSEKALVPQVKEILKNHGKTTWKDDIKKRFNSGKKEKVVATRGLWAKGENRFVDKEIFGVDSIKLPKTNRFPYYAVEGKILKKGPEELDDVKAQVTSDYQDYVEKAWTEKLRAAGKFSINEDVLKTISDN